MNSHLFENRWFDVFEIDWQGNEEKLREMQTLLERCAVIPQVSRELQGVASIVKTLNKAKLPNGKILLIRNKEAAQSEITA